MKNLVILCLFFCIGSGAIAEDKSTPKHFVAAASKESAVEKLEGTVDALTKKVEALEAAASKSATAGHGHDDLEKRVAKLEKAINGTSGTDGSGLESRVDKLETSVSKLEVTVRQI